MFTYLLGSHLLLAGRFEEYDGLSSSGKPPLLHAMEKSIKGDDETAISIFESALKIMRKTLGKRNAVFDDFSDGLFFMTLIRTNNAGSLKRARIYLSQMLRESDFSEHEWPSRFGPLSNLFDKGGLFLGRPNVPHTISKPYMPSDPFGIWILIMTGYWLNADVSAENIGLLNEAYEIMQTRGYGWLASELAELLFRLTGKDSFGTDARALRNGWTSASLIDAVRKTEPWQRTLDALKTLATAPSGKKTEASVRLVWEIHLPEDMRYGYGLFIEAKERKLLKSGRWSTGKRINPQSLNASLEHALSDQDRLVLKTLARGYSGQNDIAIEALAELAGHPAVFWRNEPETRVEIILQEPHLAVSSKGGAYRIAMEPAFAVSESEKYVIRKEAPGRIALYAIKPQHVQVARILGNTPVSIPASARGMLLDTITAISPHLSVRTDIDDSLSTSERVDPDSRPAVRLSDRASGLRLEFAVRPVPEGRLYQAGRGSQVVYETIDGKTFHAQRKFSEERRLLVKLIEECPVMASHVENPAEPVLIDDPMECLEVLDELKKAEPGVIVLRQENKPMTVTALSPGKTSFRIRPAGDWFGVDGEVAIDNHRVILFRELLDLLDTAQGRFIRLDENTFLALTREFKRRLERLRAFCSTRGGETRLHPLGAFALHDLADDIPGASLCEEWKANVARMQSVLSDVPSQPSPFTGDLRDYQKDGFVWLARLAALGAGACLADDMGLGKTIQAIALLLHRARGGAALVIAPTSVCMNWVEEIRRFAPSLVPSLLSETDRAGCITGAGPAGVIICSYGLVNNELELLAGRSWHTVILDEAQAIKNMATQRSKAVMELKADFRLVTTGTPVENHLGELWNIFRFINPGLLGTIDEFPRRFAAAIEGRNDQETKQRLKSVISPFVLRRLKSQVLDELPP
ncbi:MAG: SNF2-related protein, partial [Deltaproteobacteria bacterium]|nr:SNF2-related protein [Deltaproteobacteria bacterium]